MNWKRFWLASAAAFVAVQAIGLLVDTVFMKQDYESLRSLWRPNMMSRLWVTYVIGAMAAVLFTYIFVKGREGKGILEGVRYGIIIWLFVSVPMGVSTWVTFPIGYRVILKGLIFGLLEMLAAGILVAVIYKPKAPAKA